MVAPWREACEVWPAGGPAVPGTWGRGGEEALWEERDGGLRRRWLPQTGQASHPEVGLWPLDTLGSVRRCRARSLVTGPLRTWEHGLAWGEEGGPWLGLETWGALLWQGPVRRFLGTEGELSRPETHASPVCGCEVDVTGQVPVVAAA